jgi:glycogen phosphorylase
VMDYVRNYYSLARKQRLVMAGNQHARAKEVALWRRKLDHFWPKVRLHRLDHANTEILSDNPLSIRVSAYLDGLTADDVLVECLVGTENESGEFVRQDVHVFTHAGPGEHGETVFRLDLTPRLPGLQFYKIRIFPFHPCLSHRYESGYMIWL